MMNNNAASVSFEDAKNSMNKKNSPKNEITTVTHHKADIENANTDILTPTSPSVMGNQSNIVNEQRPNINRPQGLSQSTIITNQTVSRTRSNDRIVPNATSQLTDSRKSSLDSLAQSAILRNYRSASMSQNSESSNVTNLSRDTTEVFQIPIIGYEIMEERARFTIYKLRINDPRTGLSWMVFRRYTDFVRLYSKLKGYHPNLNLPLPGKRWFKDNFDPLFLEDRIRGLQIFVNVVIRKLSSDGMVRDFFCLDEPPPVCDAEPESLALFGALEDTVGALKNQIRQKEETIEYLKKKVFYLEEKMKECHFCNSKDTTENNKNNNMMPVATDVDH